MTFTEEDAEDDGKIKAEVGGKMKGVAKRNHAEIYEYYEKVCEEKGVDPAVLLADDLVRALNSEGHASKILETEISLKNAKMDNIRLEDVQFIREIKETFSDDDDGKEESIVKNLVKDKLKQTTSTPVSNLSGAVSNNSSPDADMAREIQRLRNEISEMKRGSGSNNVERVDVTQDRKSSADREEEVESLFWDDEEEDPEEDSISEEQDEEWEDHSQGGEAGSAEVEVVEEESREEETEEEFAEAESAPPTFVEDDEGEFEDVTDDGDREIESDSAEWGSRVEGGESWGSNDKDNDPMSASPEDEEE